jgi:hypothetical protein
VYQYKYIYIYIFVFLKLKVFKIIIGFSLLRANYISVIYFNENEINHRIYLCLHFFECGNSSHACVVAELVNSCVSICIVAPCILKIHQLLNTNKCTIIYCVYSKIHIKTLNLLAPEFYI